MELDLKSDSWRKPYCDGCQHYVPVARYQREMSDPEKRRCKHTSMCNRVAKLVKESNGQLALF